MNGQRVINSSLFVIVSVAEQSTFGTRQKTVMLCVWEDNSRLAYFWGLEVYEAFIYLFGPLNAKMGIPLVCIVGSASH